jgi:hypothetical protein
MAYWILQGNPKQFEVDTYVKENKYINWNIRQKHYFEEYSYRGSGIYLALRWLRAE